MMLPLPSGKKSCHQNPSQYYFSSSKYTSSNIAKANKILGKLCIIFKAILTEVNREPLLCSSNEEGSGAGGGEKKKKEEKRTQIWFLGQQDTGYSINKKSPGSVHT